MMGDTEKNAAKVRLYICECGPIIKEALDIDFLARSFEREDDVEEVITYSTLCSEEGRKWMAEEIAAHPDSRVVVAGCSPREHGATFMEVCRQAAFNPYLFAMANIREQCAWVTPDRHQASAKAERMIRAAVARVKRQEPLDEREIDCNTDAMVIGSGVAGLTAARLLADGGRRVYLVEKSPAIGGRTALLGDVFPDLECASCMLEPLMDEVLHHPNIECLTYSEVEGVLGFFGNYTVRIRKNARHVDLDGCYGCGSCHAACPEEQPSEFDAGLSKRKAIHIPYAGALPNVSLIDDGSCRHFRGEECSACVEACPFGNVDLDTRDEVTERQVGAIVIATGAEPQEYGEGGSSPRVLTAMALERLINASGPTGGEIRLPGQDAPRSVALIHCVDEKGCGPAEACSKVCCMSFAKYVHQISEKLPGCEMFQLVGDCCVGGRGFREFFKAATGKEGLQRISLGPKDRILGIDDQGDSVRVRYMGNGEEKELGVDLAVVAPPLVGREESRELGSILRLERSPDGFFLEDHPLLRSFRSRVDGVFVAGSAQGPKTIQEAAAHGAASAAAVLSALVPGRKLQIEPATAAVDESRCGGCSTCVLSCPYMAVSFDNESGVASVNELLCRGCGTCAATCPSGAIIARQFADDQLSAEMVALTR